MPLTINGKVFLNLQEAVAWLLANNALPFQCKVNYVADTEIAKTNIINPSPAEIKIGSLVLFADGKVGTVSGITANGFMVGADSTDLSDGVPHIIDIDLDASNHLIFTMSEGDPIDAGLVKMASSFTINSSQHLIVSYNDGTTNDLGAIFQGNINISGNLTVTGTASVNKIEIDNYNYETPSRHLNPLWLNGLIEKSAYIRAVAIGKVLYVVASCVVENDTASPITTLASTSLVDFQFDLPQEIAEKIYRKDGTTCDNAYDTEDGVMTGKITASLSNGNEIQTTNCLLYSAVANTLGIWLSAQAITIPANTKSYLDFRTFIVL